MTDVERWWDEGERIRLSVGGAERAVFVRRMGAGPAMTVLHGFPSSSHDWWAVAPALAADRALLLPDFLGFGASEKPADHEYSIHEQADLVEALWVHEGVRATDLVAHDYAVSVTQELLARRAEGALDVEIGAVTLTNGGLYPDVHRPQPVQTALLDPEQGPALAAALNQEVLTAALEPTLGPGTEAAEIVAPMWRALARDDGHLRLPGLIHYITDRRRHADRWVGALESTDVPVRFVWGMLDPVSGAHMAQRIRERLPDAPFTALDDVSHWPPLEAPERVATAIRG